MSNICLEQHKIIKSDTFTCLVGTAKCRRI